MNRCWSTEITLMKDDLKTVKDQLVLERGERLYQESRIKKTQRAQERQLADLSTRQERKQQEKRGVVKHHNEQLFSAETELPKNWRRCDGLMVELNPEPDSAPQGSQHHVSE
jgi:hypothetical protein